MTPLIETETQETEQAEAFRIDSPEAADWLLRKLANIEAEKARVTAQAAQIVAELDADRARLLHLFEGELIDFARRRLLETGGRRRTLNLLQGSIAFRTVPASVRVADPFAALDYCQTAAPALVRTQVTIDREAYQRQAAKHWQETGKLLPGVETTPAHESHRITFGGK